MSVDTLVNNINSLQEKLIQLQSHQNDVIVGIRELQRLYQTLPLEQKRPVMEFFSNLGSKWYKLLCAEAYDSEMMPHTVGDAIEELLKQRTDSFWSPIYAVRKIHLSDTNPYIRPVDIGIQEYFSHIHVFGNRDVVVLYMLKNEEYPIPLYSEGDKTYLPCNTSTELAQRLKDFDPDLPCMFCHIELKDLDTPESILSKHLYSVTMIRELPGYYDGARYWYEVKDNQIVSSQKTKDGTKTEIDGTLPLYCLSQRDQVYPMIFTDVDPQVTEQLQKEHNDVHEKHMKFMADFRRD